MTPRPTLIALAAPLAALAALALVIPGAAAGQERPPPKDPPTKVAPGLAPAAAAQPADDTHGTRPAPKEPPPKGGPKPHRSLFEGLTSFLGFSRYQERADPGDPPLKGLAVPPVKGGPAPPVKGVPN